MYICTFMYEYRCILHPTKIQYLNVNSNDEAPFNLQDVAIVKTNKYYVSWRPNI
jgi:hypothetical protein